MKYFFIAGEASGDLHASNCMKEILKLDNQAKFAFTGGDLMESVSGEIAAINIRKMAFMGFIDVLKNIRTINKNFKIVKDSILKFKPDLLVLVDYPGFNLRMAKWAFENGIKVDYFISPTVWAWKEGRIYDIKKYINKLFVILPFEEAFYKKHNYKAYFIGHPLIDAIDSQKENFKSKENFIKVNGLNEKPIIAVLPGSRFQEIQKMLKVMIDVAPLFKDYQFVFAGASNLNISNYSVLKKHQLKIVFNQTYELMSYAKAGIIKSGTSTLESALFKLPQVVCYKGGAISFAIGKRLVNVKYISLVNLIMDQPIVKELIQNDFTVKNISSELNQLLTNISYRNKIISAYEELILNLGGVGASKKIAKYIVDDANFK